MFEHKYKEGSDGRERPRDTSLQGVLSVVLHGSECDPYGALCRVSAKGDRRPTYSPPGMFRECPGEGNRREQRLGQGKRIFGRQSSPGFNGGKRASRVRVILRFPTGDKCPVGFPVEAGKTAL